MDDSKLDYKTVASNISKKCDFLLKEVDVNTVSDTFEAVKEIVEISIETYFYKVSEFWQEENAQTEIQRQIKFTDVDNGYEISVKKWVLQNPFKADIPICPENTTELYEEYKSKLHKKAVAIGATGTAAIGIAYVKNWWIFGNPIIAVAAELLNLTVLCMTIRRCKKLKSQEIEVHIHMIEAKQKEYKKQLVETLIAAAKIWLQKAEAYSNKILKEF